MATSEESTSKKRISFKLEEGAESIIKNLHDYLKEKKSGTPENLKSAQDYYTLISDMTGNTLYAQTTWNYNAYAFES
jgi:hypothetical protein